MSGNVKYLVIGPFGSSHDPAAATAMALALAASQHGSVTCLIDDLAADLPNTNKLAVIRRREFEHNIGDYAEHKRIYCLGNSFESLFALELLHQYPGVVVTHGGSYHDLILSLFQSQDNWPDNYTQWLVETLGESGRTISHALLQHRRLPSALGAEALDRTPLDLCTHAQITLASDALFPYVPNIKPIPVQTTQLETILCVGIPPDTITAVNHDIENLGRGIRLQACHASDPDMIERIIEADIVVLGSKETPSPALSISLQLGKAIIVAGHAWQRWLPGDCHLQIDNTGARHQLLAAVGAITLDPTLRSTLQDAAMKYWQQHAQPAKLDELFALTKKQLTLEVPTQTTGPAASPNHQPAHTDTLSVPDILFEATSSTPTALIGSVPAPNLVAKILPGIDPTSSPRFATPALAHALSVLGHNDPHSLLAHLGFETPIIRTKDDTGHTTHGDLKHVHDWPHVCSGLRSADYAVAFNAQVAGIASVQHIDADVLANCYGTEITFADSLEPTLKQKTLSVFDRVMGHLDGPGLFWHLDKARRCVQCVTIVGITGQYTLSNNGKADSAVFIIASETGSATMQNNPVTLRASPQGILTFSIRAINTRTKAPLDNMFLLKSLAESRMKLEWSSHE